MNDERLKILEMLENGTITAAEANELLSSADNAKESAEKKESKTASNTIVFKGTGKYLKIRIDDDGDKVNVTLPMAFLKSALGAGGVGKIIDKSLNNVDDDIKSTIDMDMIISCIDSDFVGEIVNIDADDTKVLITIE